MDDVLVTSRKVGRKVEKKLDLYHLDDTILIYKQLEASVTQELLYCKLQRWRLQLSYGH